MLILHIRNLSFYVIQYVHNVLYVRVIVDTTYVKHLLLTFILRLHIIIYVQCSLSYFINYN